MKDGPNLYKVGNNFQVPKVLRLTSSYFVWAIYAIARTSRFFLRSCIWRVAGNMVDLLIYLSKPFCFEGMPHAQFKLNIQAPSTHDSLSWWQYLTLETTPSSHILAYPGMLQYRTTKTTNTSQSTVMICVYNTVNITIYICKHVAINEKQNIHLFRTQSIFLHVNIDVFFWHQGLTPTSSIQAANKACAASASICPCKAPLGFRSYPWRIPWDGSPGRIFTDPWIFVDFYGINYYPEISHGTRKWWFPKEISFSRDFFSGSMLNFRGVVGKYTYQSHGSYGIEVKYHLPTISRIGTLKM